MFCPICGKSDQQPDTYCRQCGEYLYDPESTGRRGPKTPADQFRLSIVFNVLSAVAAISMATALLIYHAGLEKVTPLIWSAISLLYVIGTWQIISFANNLKLRKRFIKKEAKSDDSVQVNASHLEGVKESDLVLPEADHGRIEPASVTDSTTRKLGEKISREG